MLVPVLIDLLIGCSLMLLAGWVGETLRAGADGAASDPRAGGLDPNESSVGPVVMR
jgi:hypothetical protein